MNIAATDVALTFGRQTRAFAEDRIFRSLARHGDAVREADVSLTPDQRGHSVVCSVLVSLQNGMLVGVTARGRHAYDAINRVVHRIDSTLRGYTHLELQS